MRAQAAREGARLRQLGAAFTSCGSESDNWALWSGAESVSRRGGHVISSTVEHDAVRKALDELERRGYEVTRLTPGPDGAVSPEQVAAAARPDTVLCSLMLVNNETGAVTDIKAVSKAAQGRRTRTPSCTRTRCRAF